ncbi:MAG: MFS transporter [Bryobacterales bacterium]|nr:MFS transporter [Bryobacterales bacterium]
MPPELNLKREQRAWYVYDWANSAFSTTVVTLFLGPYLTVLARAAADSNLRVHPLGISIDARAYWSYLVALSVALQVVVLPIAGAIADASRRKKLLLGLFAYAGAFCTMAMYFVAGDRYGLGGALFVVANVSFGASIVIYNSYLPEIATPEERDRVSSKGWGMGYLGGGLLLTLNLLLYENAAAWGLPESMAVRISLCSAGVWWAVFSIVPLRILRNHHPVGSPAGSRNPLSNGFRQLLKTLRELRSYPQTLLFLLAYLLYNDAIQAVINLSTQFGNDELGISISNLTMVILMVQFVAFFGAIGFGWFAQEVGAKPAVMAALVIWTAVLVAMYLWIRTTAQFFVMAGVVGLVLGGSQALSRSLFSLMIPKGKEAEYFSLYEISDKGTSWMAPLIFGLALQFTASYRLAILSLIVFFVLGFLLLWKVDVTRAAREAEAGGR